MSAECSTCGFDLVYPPGTWPIGECQACEDRAALQKVEKALARWLARDFDSADPVHHVAVDALATVRARLGEEKPVT